MSIRGPVLRLRQVTCRDFVQFWERLYFPYDENFYQKHIVQPPKSEQQIIDWFEWKNGMPLSEKKKKTILRHFVPDRECIGHDADTDTLTTFLNRPGGAIWCIFWLHLQHPRHFPIYDQNVHRAMAFMLKWTDHEIPASNPKKVRIYLEKYRPFLSRFDDCKPRQVDRALWSFGRFLQIETYHEWAVASAQND